MQDTSVRRWRRRVSCHSRTTSHDTTRPALSLPATRSAVRWPTMARRQLLWKSRPVETSWWASWLPGRVRTTTAGSSTGATIRPDSSTVTRSTASVIRRAAWQNEPCKCAHGIILFLPLLGCVACADCKDAACCFRFRCVSVCLLDTTTSYGEDFQKTAEDISVLLSW